MYEIRIFEITTSINEYDLKEWQIVAYNVHKTGEKYFTQINVCCNLYTKKTILNFS